MKPEIIRVASRLVKVYGEKEIGSVWCFASPQDRLAVDSWIVATKHPLGLEPGTAEQRFRKLVLEDVSAS